MSLKLKLPEIITDVFKTTLKCLTFNMKSERKLLFLKKKINKSQKI